MASSTLSCTNMMADAAHGACRHGVDQPRNPWSDGPEYITQSLIQPGAAFAYRVILSQEEGTLWWHAHTGFDGATVHGAIVVLPDWRGGEEKAEQEARAESTLEEAEPRMPGWGAHGSRSKGAEPSHITVGSQRNGIADGVAQE